MKKILAIMLTAIALIASGCGKDDGPDNPEKPDVPETPVTPPTQEVEDPEGTVRLSMRNDNNGGTTLGQLYIDKADNFAVSGSGKIVDLGEMKGLGNVTYIPKKGWANKASVVPGHGYVLCEFDYQTGNPKFTRFYCLEYMTAAVTGGIIGAEIKYQTPFNGLDESLKLDTKKVSLPAEGGEVAVTISNSYFTPFTAEVTGSEMPCTVKRGAMTDMPYIYDGIIIECPETLAAEEKKTTVTITTAFGRTETIEVTQMPRGEFINLGMNGTEIAMEGCEDAPLITVFTNIVLSDIRVETDAPWLTAVLETTPRENARARFRSIEGKEVEPESRATVDYMLEGVVRLTAGPNTAAEAREATISLSYGSVEKSVKFTQAGAGTLPEFEDLTFDAKAQDSYISFNPGGFSRKIFFEVEESADLCRVTMDGIVSGEVMRVILTANESIEARTAKVTAYAFNEECGSFTVTQKGIEEMPKLQESYILSATETSRTFNYDPGDCPAADLSVRSTNDYFTVETVPNANTLKVTTDAVNFTDKAIEGKIEMLYEGKVVASAKLIQEGSKYTDDVLYAPKNGGNFHCTIANPQFPFKPKVDKSFLTAQVINGELYLRIEETTENRSATVSFDEIGLTVKVHQTKYSNSLITECDGLLCQVYNLATGFASQKENAGTGFLIHKLDDEYQWSTECVYLGCGDNGVENMKKVMNVPNWESLYPAFAAVNALNADGSFTWFFPSSRQLGYPSKPRYISSGNYTWSSTETTQYNAMCYHRPYAGDLWDSRLKTEKAPVVAMREFDFFAE